MGPVRMGFHEMNATRILQATAWVLVGCHALLEGQPAKVNSASDAVGVTAVYSMVRKDYVRTKLPDGSFKPEEYALGKGGRLDGSLRDDSIDNSKFIDIARAIAGPLASQNYRPAKKQDAEDLLIMVFWGTTIVPDPLSMSPGLAGSGHEITNNNVGQLYTDDIMRKQIDRKNALLLGYDPDVSAAGGNPVHTGTARDWKNEELLSELEDTRYFVVLLAFDFHAFQTEKKHKLLWETRFSINESKNQFNKALPIMAQYAAKYFGQDSHGLMRTSVPDGKVLIGESKTLGEVEAPQK